jgi:hypothetical protein
MYITFKSDKHLYFQRFLSIEQIPICCFLTLINFDFHQRELIIFSIDFCLSKSGTYFFHFISFCCFSYIFSISLLLFLQLPLLCELLLFRNFLVESKTVFQTTCDCKYFIKNPFSWRASNIYRVFFICSENQSFIVKKFTLFY